MVDLTKELNECTAALYGQRCVLSLLLFNLYMVDLTKELNECTAALYGQTMCTKPLTVQFVYDGPHKGTK